MSRTRFPDSDAQLQMPGMPRTRRVMPSTALSCCNVRLGQTVVYVGKIAGGPKYGTVGRVQKVLQLRAVVDMGERGVWTVPYYFLSDQALEPAVAA